jgi:1-acyl-sn-glycerol-3-phosphate acyltransferase
MTIATARVPLSVRAAYFVAASMVRPSLALLVDRRYDGFEHVPRGQGCIICANHITEIDPIVVGHAFYVHGLYAHFLAKDSLFRNRAAGAMLRAMGQIPVERRASAGQRSLAEARRVLDYGGVIVIYPEGTLTRDPALWPMRARSGAARLALETGAPVLPLAQWGAHELLPPYARRLRIRPRKTVQVRVGAPLDLSAFAGRPLEREVLEGAMEHIQTSTTMLLASLRHEPPPLVRFDPNASPRPA